MSFFAELKRRNVFKVGLAYLALGWIIIQVTSLAVPALNLPTSLNSIVFYISFIGFPIALFFAWAFELTPEGIKLSTEVESKDSKVYSTGRKLDFILIGLLLLALIFVTFDNYFSTEINEPTLNNSSSDQQDISIAVLPLLNMSAVAENAFFAGGIHEEILTNLSYIKALKVTSRTSAMRYSTTDLNTTDIGKELKVRYIVEGSVRRADNYVRVTVQLIDATTDTHLWANNYDRELTDIFSVQSAIAKEISQALQSALQPNSATSLESMPTHNLQAYNFYLEAIP